MPDTLFRSLVVWPIAPWLWSATALSLVIYFRGWLRLHRRHPQRWPVGRLFSFVVANILLLLALASPLDTLAAFWLSAHMVQHLLLMMLVPPLVWLAAPFFPLLVGLPGPVRDVWVRPWLQSPGIRAAFARLTYPPFALAVFVVATVGWHLPLFYDQALRVPLWHRLEHVSFLAAGLLFWYPVLRPYPSRPRWNPWLLVPYLLAADVLNTVLSATFTFAGHVLYPYYEQIPRLAGFKPLDDQAVAGVLMWVPGSVAFLLPLAILGVRLMRTAPASTRPTAAAPRRMSPVPRPLLSLPVVERDPARGVATLVQPARFDLLRVPVVGRLLQASSTRLVAQVLLGLVAAAVIYHGLRGPQIAPLNLAGVLPWIHWRGLIVLGLLVAGNWFCFACPFTLPRYLARRWLPGGRAWPRSLRNKWPAVLLLGLFLWSYEALALWNSPWWTAWIAIGYFVAAFAIDGWFRGASFCKYVCPIGQFQFVQALVSPLTVAVREPAACAGCQTHDCLAGRAELPGCELHLFQPRKQGNLDCTFCLDCVRACPHDNVGVLAMLPGRTLWTDSNRSGVGRFSRRPDLAALVLVLVFGAWANAAGMVAPVVAWRSALASRLGSAGDQWLVTAGYFLALICLPILFAGTAACLSRRWAGLSENPLRIANRFAFSLVPLGFGMWLAHYSYHLFTSYDAVWPAVSQFASDLNFPTTVPAAGASCCRTVGAWLPRLEILFLDAGLLLSLYTAYRLARVSTTQIAAAWKCLAPWAAAMAVLFVAGVWIILQPMEMRGTLPAPAQTLAAAEN